jgi:hypothetical protein
MPSAPSTLSANDTGSTREPGGTDRADGADGRFLPLYFTCPVVGATLAHRFTSYRCTTGEVQHA